MLLSDIKILLLKAQAAKGQERIEHIRSIQNLIWNDESIEDENINNILTDIAHVLDFYEPNEERRKEDSSYYGDEKLNEEIDSMLTKFFF